MYVHLLLLLILYQTQLKCLIKLHLGTNNFFLDFVDRSYEFITTIRFTL